MSIFKKINSVLLKITNKDIDDLYWNNNNFDGKIKSTLEWFGGDNLETYIKNGNKKYGLKDITYKINEYGYRVNENNLSSKNIIACFGCSNTFGQGLPWNETWVSVLNKKLGSKWVTKNYGSCGASNDKISRLISNYLSYNKPKFICCYFPDIFRLEMFDCNGELKDFTPHDNNRDVYDYKSYKRISNEEYCVYNFIKNFKFIYNTCKLNKVNFYWNTWSIPILNLGKYGISKMLDFDSFTKSLFDDSDIYRDLPENFDWKLITARDGAHLGSFLHEKIAESFYKKIIKDIK